MSHSHQLFTNTENSSIDRLHKFYQNIPFGENVLLLVGGGTAALTYLYTAEIEAKYTHIVVLGGRGYWETTAHRLAQPRHILALPHTKSEQYMNPAKHDEEKGLLPHQPASAYAHSCDFQITLTQLEKATLDVLAKKGKKVFIAKDALVKRIEKIKASLFTLEINKAKTLFFANKIIVASGAGPARKLPQHLQVALNDSKMQKHTDSRIFNYTDILTPTIAEKCRNKAVLIYGGGATAAWAMEVADLIATPIAWVAKSGFNEAIEAGPRVNAIIRRSRSVQVDGIITHIDYLSGKKKLCIRISNSKNSSESKDFTVDYLVNCIGQEPYEPGGLPHILSSNIKKELTLYRDKNNVTGTEQSSFLGWATGNGDLLIIGAAQGTYYNSDRVVSSSLPSVSSFLPISGQVPITIGGVVSSVCALTNYMPISQDMKTGKVTVSSLNIHIMNATQLAVYFTARYPNASAMKINEAVKSFIRERRQTDFGLSEQRLSEFMDHHFGDLSTSKTQNRMLRSRL